MVSIPVDVSGIVDGESIDADDVLIPLADLKEAIENALNGVQAFELLMLNTATEVTISGGAITVDRNHHRVDTELNAAADDLDTINGGVQGMVLYLRPENTARVVTVKHGTGNIYLSGGVDYTLSSANMTLMLFYNGTKWTDISNTITPPTITFIDSVVILRDEKTAGSHGGTFTAGAWRTRTLNTESSDTGGLCTLASDEFTLAAGTYYILAHAPGYRVDQHQARLYNVTDATQVIAGTSGVSGSSADNTHSYSIVEGIFTTAGGKAFRIEHRGTTTGTNTGFGIAYGSITEVYTTVYLFKVA